MASVLQLLLLLSFAVAMSSAFTIVVPSCSNNRNSVSSIVTSTRRHPLLVSKMTDDDDKEDSTTDEEGVFLAAEFSKFTKAEGIELTEDDLDNEDVEDPDDELDERVDRVADELQKLKPEFESMGDDVQEVLDTGDTESNVTLTNDEIYSQVKERVLDTAGGFVQLVGGAEDQDLEMMEESKPKIYKPPTTVPDSGLTAGEVVELVLQALLNNDNPTKNRGLEILFGYSSPSSQIKNEVGLTPEEYGDFLKETEYKVLFEHEGIIVEKGDYSFDGLKAFYTARLRIGPGPKDFVSVNFILSTKGQGEEDCWLVDSMLIRPQAMRRRRRK